MKALRGGRRCGHGDARCAVYCDDGATNFGACSLGESPLTPTLVWDSRCQAQILPHGSLHLHGLSIGGWLSTGRRRSTTTSQAAPARRQPLRGQDNLRRACHRVATIAPQPCIRCGMARGGRPRDIRTMMQPCASAARLLGGGPILSLGSKPWVGAGHRHLGSSWRCIAPAADERQTCLTPPLLVSAPCGVSADPLRLPAAA